MQLMARQPRFEGLSRRITVADQNSQRIYSPDFHPILASNLRKRCGRTFSAGRFTLFAIKREIEYKR
jgi:hypothetical protein